MRGFLGTILLFCIILIGSAEAHQVNLSTARVELRPQREVAVEVALKGSDADRLAGTHVFDEQKGLVDPAKIAAFAAPIAAYVGSHVGVTGADGTPCAASAPEVVADGDGVIVRNTFSCRNVAGDLAGRLLVPDARLRCVAICRDPVADREEPDGQGCRQNLCRQSVC